MNNNEMQTVQLISTINMRHSNRYDPTPDQKSALSGTDGTASSTNLFVTDSDPRNTDARTPLAHIHTESDTTNLVSDLAAKAPLNSPTFTGTPAAPTAAAGTNTTQLATTAYARSAAPNSSYRIIDTASGSHIATKVAGTYIIPGGDPLAVSGTGVLYPITLIPIASADYPTVNGLAPKLRIRAIVSVNATAPTGNFTVGLYPVTSGGGAAGLKIYSTGTLVSGSATSTVTAPAANSMTGVVGSDFSLPSDGTYCMAVVTTATVATSSLVHVNAALQMRNA